MYDRLNPRQKPLMGLMGRGSLQLEANQPFFSRFEVFEFLFILTRASFGL
jgi:hypothetical protein